MAGSASFEGDSKEIAKEILILRKELAEDEQNKLVMSGVKVVDRGHPGVVHQPLQARCAGRGAGRPGPGPGQRAGPDAPAAVKCWGSEVKHTTQWRALVQSGMPCSVVIS